MHVLIEKYIKDSEKNLQYDNRQVTWIILIQFRFLPTYVTNYFITTKLYVNWYVA